MRSMTDDQPDSLFIASLQLRVHESSPRDKLIESYTERELL